MILYDENRNEGLLEFGIQIPVLASRAVKAFEFLKSHELLGPKISQWHIQKIDELIRQKKWPCYFFNSDTTGEKDYEEFFTIHETLDMNRFSAIGVIKNPPEFDDHMLNEFVTKISYMRSQGNWNKEDLLALFNLMISEFQHKEKGKYLDQKM